MQAPHFQTEKQHIYFPISQSKSNPFPKPCMIQDLSSLVTEDQSKKGKGREGEGKCIINQNLHQQIDIQNVTSVTKLAMRKRCISEPSFGSKTRAYIGK